MITLANPNVNGGAPVGFFVKPGSYRVELPHLRHARATATRGLSYVDLGPWKRHFYMVVLCRNQVRNLDGTINSTTALQWHDLLWGFYQRVNESHAFVDPQGVAYTVRFDACTDQVVPFGSQPHWVLEWETRVTLVET